MEARGKPVHDNAKDSATGVLRIMKCTHWLALLVLFGNGGALPATAIAHVPAWDNVAQQLQHLQQELLHHPAAVSTQAQAMRQEIEQLRQSLLQTKLSLPEQQKQWQQLQAYDHQVVKLVRASQLLQDMQSVDEKTLLSPDHLPLLEAWERALQELADDWHPTVDERKKMADAKGVDDLAAAKPPPNQAPPTTATEILTKEKQTSANPYQEMAAAYRVRISQIQKHHTPAQQPHFRTYSIAPTATMTGTWSTDVQQLFRQFDRNQDGRLTLGEGEAFFYWVSRVLSYRYDDEKLTGVRPGFAIGDGRPGPDYRQTPPETLREKMGDCEDLATLQASFYQSFGIKSYVVCVNAQNKQLLDHAIAIVKIGDTPTQYRQALGGLLYYQIQAGQRDVRGQAISPGYYMAVDSAYSSTFGYISGGIQPGAFRLKCIFPAQEVFGAAWDRALKTACGGFISH